MIHSYVAVSADREGEVRGKAAHVPSTANAIDFKKYIKRDRFDTNSGVSKFVKLLSDHCAHRQALVRFRVGRVFGRHRGEEGARNEEEEEEAGRDAPPTSSRGATCPGTAAVADHFFQLNARVASYILTVFKSRSPAPRETY